MSQTVHHSGFTPSWAAETFVRGVSVYVRWPYYDERRWELPISRMPLCIGIGWPTGLQHLRVN